MIEIKNIDKSFGQKNVLENISFSIKKNSIFGLVGINGAGKSTLLRMMSGIYEPDNGSILYDGNPVFENKKVKKKIFFLQDDPFYLNKTTGKDLENIYSYFYNLNEEKLNKYLSKYNLDLTTPVKNLSKGMRRQLFLCFALACRPEYIFLDEAFDGLDPLARLTLKRALIELISETNTTVVISSHSLRELEDICDSYCLLDNKNIVESGDLTKMLDQIYKYQLAFNEPIKEEAFKDFDLLNIEITNKTATVVIKGDKEKIIAELKKLNPLMIDIATISFEDLFIYEVKRRGYLLW